MQISQIPQKPSDITSNSVSQLNPLLKTHTHNFIQVRQLQQLKCSTSCSRPVPQKKINKECMTVLLPVRPRSCETISIDKKSRDDLANFIFAKERAFSYYCCHYILSISCHFLSSFSVCILQKFKIIFF